ncbi:ATPase [Clavibacter michiganensis]|uniref:MinD/ParA family ATP-binding protein n=1 Tax=Clavibacter michiganensis TaxID=28447 RepID=UPI000CE92BDB|nr:ATPase [Clavibacter michiganensis]PPF53405.1 ATPase [Clavibacter michiganensis]
MTDDTTDTGHRDGGASEPPLLSRRELRRRQQEMEQGSPDASGDAHRWVDPFPAVPRTSEGGLFGPDRVRPGAAPADADPDAAGDADADAADEGAPLDADAEVDDDAAEVDDDAEVVGTHAFDELFDDADEDDVDPEDRVPDEAPAETRADADDAPRSAAEHAPGSFDAVVSPEAGSAWTVPAPHVVNAHPFRMPLRPSAEEPRAARSGDRDRSAADTAAAAPQHEVAPEPEVASADDAPVAVPVDDAPVPASARPAAARTASAPAPEPAPQPVPVATPVASLPAAPDDAPEEEPAQSRRPGTDLTAFPDADPQRYAMRTPRPDAATSALTLFPEQTGQRPPRGPVVARTGFRGFLNTVTGGLLKIGPGPEEAAANAEATRREGDERIIRQATWSRAVSVLVANRKGGVGKTPTSLILGGVLGSIRGGSVAVVEVTDDPGALGYRAEGQPQRGLGELVRDRDEIHSAGQLAGYTAPQTSFASVVASVGPRRELTGEDVVGVSRLIDEYYAVRVMDSGNQPSSSAFRGAIEVTDVLVVPVLNAGDAVLEAVALLDFLRELGGHAEMLADNAVIIRLHDGRPEDPAVVARIDRILDDARPAQIFTVPYDAHIAERGPISLGSLGPEVLRAFTAATAGVVQRLAHAVR